MTRIAYLDCFAGVSGDMMLGALLDAGWSLGRLQAVIAALRLADVSAHAEIVTKQSIAGTQVTLVIPSDQPHRHPQDLVDMIHASALPAEIQAQAVAAIKLLGEAESQVHRVPFEQIHFHEVGAVDTLVDIVGALVGLHDLGVQQVYSAPLPWSQGSVRAAHGLLPVPPPAVALLLQGIPVVGVEVQGEMVTPTGATLVRTLARGFGPPPAMTVERIGYGAGRKNWPERPNLLRIVIGETADAAGLLVETLTTLACNLDDMNPQWYGPLVQILLEAKALDVWLTPVQMKKNRPATVVEVLCRSADATHLRNLLLRHTTTLGVRQQTVTRYGLDRHIETVQTPYGPVRVKVADLPDGTRKAAPEHDDCVARAAERGVSVREVWLAAVSQMCNA